MNDSKKAKNMNLAYGGQALIEGILMRTVYGYAFTVRTSDGTLYKESGRYMPPSNQHKIFRYPFIRGVVGIAENFVFGSNVLSKSADIAYPEDGADSKRLTVLATILLYVFLFSVALLIFVAAPYFITGIFKLDHVANPFFYNLISGVIRVFFLFIYLLLIYFNKDTKRLFAYHGAEHKTVNAFENGSELNVENVKKYSRLHPRCGTAFLFIVFLVTIAIFPFFNILFNTQIWYIELHWIVQKIVIICSHIFVGIPIIASVSYEILRLSSKYEDNFIVKILILPGLFFQLFTTRTPDDEQIEVAIESLNMVRELSETSE